MACPWRIWSSKSDARGPMQWSLPIVSCVDAKPAAHMFRSSGLCHATRCNRRQAGRHARMRAMALYLTHNVPHHHCPTKHHRPPSVGQCTHTHARTHKTAPTTPACTYLVRQQADHEQRHDFDGKLNSSVDSDIRGRRSVSLPRLRWWCPGRPLGSGRVLQHVVYAGSSEPSEVGIYAALHGRSRTLR